MAETTKRILSYLPLEVTSCILSLLPIEDILRCRTVCKAWYRLTKEPFFINLQLQATESQRDRVILIPKSKSIYLLNTEGKNVREISLSTILKSWMWHLTVVGSCRGFLCIASQTYPDPVLVCNPVTKEHVVLPKAAPSVFPFGHAAFGYDPSSDKYKAVKVYMDNISGLSRVLIHTLGETSWRPLELTYRVLTLMNVLPKYSQGALYWMINKVVHKVGNEFILALNLSTEKFHIISFPENTRLPTCSPGSDGQGLKNLYLANAGKNVILSEKEARLMHLWVMRRKKDGNFYVRYFQVELYVRWNVFSWPVIISKMGDFVLLEVTKFGMDEERDLVLYCPRRKKYFSSQIQGLPARFRSLLFQPNLLSPLVASD